MLGVLGWWHLFQRGQCYAGEPRVIKVFVRPAPLNERAEFVEGDESLRSAGAQLRDKDFPVKFPDVSSVKIVRRAQITCSASGCAIELLPIDTTQSRSGPAATAGNK